MVLGELGGRLVIQRAMRPLLVVVHSPFLDDLPGIRHAREPMFVEAFVAQRTVEAEDEHISLITLSL